MNRGNAGRRDTPISPVEAAGEQASAAMNARQAVDASGPSSPVDLSGATVAITGGTGSFGSTMTRHLPTLRGVALQIEAATAHVPLHTIRRVADPRSGVSP